MCWVTVTGAGCLPQEISRRTMRSASLKFLRAASSTVWLPAVPLAGVTVSQSASSPVTVSV